MTLNPKDHPVGTTVLIRLMKVSEDWGKNTYSTGYSVPTKVEYGRLFEADIAEWSPSGQAVQIRQLGATVPEWLLVSDYEVVEVLP